MINSHALFSGRFENVCLPVQSNLRLIVRCLRFIFTLIAKLAIEGFMPKVLRRPFSQFSEVCFQKLEHLSNLR